MKITKDGEIRIKHATLSPNITPDDLIIFQERSDLNLLIANDEWETYRLSGIDEGETILIVQFFKKVLMNVNICLGMKYLHYSQADSLTIIKERLLDLGGEKEYSWGSVQLNNDLKSGYYSILIKYDSIQPKISQFSPLA